MESTLAQIMNLGGASFAPEAFETLGFWMKTLSLLITVLLLGGIALAAIRMNYVVRETFRDLAEAFRQHPLPKRPLQRRWDKIRARLEQGGEAEYKLAVIEADKLVDGIIEHMGYHGTSLGERLQQIKPAHLSTIEELWRAHKIRNAIVHDPDRSIGELEAEEAIRGYETTLKELGVID